MLYKITIRAEFGLDLFSLSFPKTVYDTFISEIDGDVITGVNSIIRNLNMEYGYDCKISLYDISKL